MNEVRNGKGAYGFNAATEEYDDLVKAGVIDPTKVVRSALQNAASVAGLMLTTEALVAEIPKEEPAMAAVARPRRRHGRHGLLRPLRSTHGKPGHSCSGFSFLNLSHRRTADDGRARDRDPLGRCLTSTHG